MVYMIVYVIGVGECGGVCQRVPVKVRGRLSGSCFWSSNMSSGIERRLVALHDKCFTHRAILLV